MRGRDGFARPTRCRGGLRLSAALRPSKCSSVRAVTIRPFAFVRLLWPLLTSPLLSRQIAPAVVRCERTRTEISSGKACLLLADPPNLPRRCGMTIGLPRPWPGDPTCNGLIFGFCTSSPGLRHRLSSDSASRRTPLLKASHTEHTRPKGLPHIRQFSSEFVACKAVRAG